MADFSPTQALGIPQQSYDDYWSGATAGQVQSPLQGFDPYYEFPDRYSQKMFALPYDPLHEQEVAAATGARMARLQGLQELQADGTDWTTPEGQQRVTQLLAKGAISPQEATALERAAAIQERSQQRAAALELQRNRLNRPSKYNPNLTEGQEGFLHDILKMDYSDPEAANENLNNLMDQYGPGVSVSPVVYDAIQKTKARIEGARKEALISRRDPDQYLINKLTQHSIPPPLLEPLFDDEGKLKDAESRKTLRDLISRAAHNEWVEKHTGINKLREAAYSYIPPSEEALRGMSPDMQKIALAGDPRKQFQSVVNKYINDPNVRYRPFDFGEVSPSTTSTVPSESDLQATINKYKK